MKRVTTTDRHRLEYGLEKILKREGLDVRETSGPVAGWFGLEFSSESDALKARAIFTEAGWDLTVLIEPDGAKTTYGFGTRPGGG